MYLIIFTIQSKHYLGVDPEGNILGYDDKDHVMKAFRGFIEAFQRDYTWSMSATIAMTQIQPVAIRFDKKAEELRPYVISDRVLTFSSMAVRKMHGVEVSKDILEFTEFDIFKEVLNKSLNK